ncbi:glycosyltransferase, partial [Sphingomonadaceae bacterium]|nr:glycosyltransferase [Sphingomonadaceae bacterium]
TVCEAAACGCALIISDAKGHLEIVKPSLEGLFFPAGDSQAIAENISWLFENPHEIATLQKRAEQASHRFTWSKATKSLENSLCDLVE